MEPRDKHPATGQVPDYKAYSLRYSVRMRPLRRGAVVLGVRALLLLAGRFSLRRLQRMGAALGRIAYRLSARQRRLCEAQLTMALPELPPEEHRRIARACMEQQGMTLMETLGLHRLAAGGAPWLRLDGEDELIAAHARGHGVVLVTAHTGNWELLRVALERIHIPTLVIVSRNANPRINEMMADMRRTRYVETAERGSAGAARKILNCLKGGNGLVLAIDVDIEAQGVFVDFFGVPANTPLAPASLALRFAAPVVTYFDIRQPDGSHLFRFREVPVTEQVRGAEDPARALTQAVMGRIEAHIRAYPEQWAWNHRRWKRRPPTEQGPPAPG